MCEDCSPFKCESCGNISTLAFSSIKQYNLIKEEADTIMGWGAHIGACKDCGNLESTGDMGICITCAIKKIDKKHIVCHTCLTKAPAANIWKYDKNDDECCLCYKNDKLNARGICQTCFNIVHEIKTDKICPICQKRTIKEDEYSCEECLGNKFP